MEVCFDIDCRPGALDFCWMIVCLGLLALATIPVIYRVGFCPVAKTSDLRIVKYCFLR